MYGSWAYVQSHADDLDGHVMASSYDTGTGRIRGFLTNGRLTEMEDVLEAALAPVADLGPFHHTDVAIYGTDHYDFVIEGIAGLVADQESANYEAALFTGDVAATPSIVRTMSLETSLEVSGPIC